jgi:ABC-type uncharacterized transport system involved in gliding motility auxiliary subunit
MNAHRERGAALATALHVVLLLLVLAQIVYLASRHRVRVDLTSDQLWSSTASTRELVARLDKRLVIEAYFSPKEKLPVAVRESRAWADNFLDELVQIGGGKVVLQRFDPNADKALADRAARVGIQPIDLASRSSTSVSQDRHWQGLRLVYGGGKQKVIKQFAPPSSFVAEAIVTPAIKEVMTAAKRKFGYMEWPATNPGGPQQGGLGWNALRTFEGIANRYEFQNFKDEDGALLPPDLDTLFLFRPKDLTDRQKYVLDQFVVRGGTLVAFVDAAEYLIGPQRSFTRLPMALDAAGSKQKFPEQLLHYGIDWRQRVVADVSAEAYTPRDLFRGPNEYFAALQLTANGQRMVPMAYPYFFHPVAIEWREVANDLAKDPKTGQVDKDLAEQYRKQFVNGLPSDEFLFKAFKLSSRGPGLYWPTWVGLREKAGGVADLPPGVDGRVLMWSSPRALSEDPPQQLNLLGGNDPQQRKDHQDKFYAKLAERLLAEPRQQAPLMVEVKGRFSSFFAGHDRPKRPSEIKEEEAKKAAAENPPTPPPDVADPNAAAAKPVLTDAKPETPAVAAEAAMVERGEKPGRIVVVGDSDFIRDDLVNGVYSQAGGPVSANSAVTFFAQLLDWLAEDRDLVALQSKVAVDRSLKFVDGTAASGADPRLQEQALRSKTTWLRAINVVGPGLLLVVLGLCVWAWRRAQKRSFLATVN